MAFILFDARESLTQFLTPVASDSCCRQYYGLGQLSRRRPLCDSHPATEIAIPRNSKANWLDLRGVFHGDARCVTKRQPASEIAVATCEVSEGHIFYLLVKKHPK
jgi:hypothetical protein